MKNAIIVKKHLIIMKFLDFKLDVENAGIYKIKGLRLKMANGLVVV